MSINQHDRFSKERRLIEAARAQEGPQATTVADPGSWGGNTWWPELPSDAFAGYEIVRRLDQGGQGIVFEAVQKGTRRRVAIKALHRGPLAGSAERVRFDREVQILGQLRHPNIVTIHHAGLIQGSCYLVMDYIAGMGLDRYVASRQTPVAEALRMFLKIGRAIQAAHLRGIIHRDLKPSNIRVDDHGEPHILDFGLAKTDNLDHDGRSRTAYEVTLTGQFLGTLPWASPEQVGATSEDLDLRSDIYALGLILFHMLTGRHPYPVAGPAHDVVRNVLECAPRRLRSLRKDIAPDVDIIVSKCLAKERDRRYQSVGEIIEDVECYLERRPIRAHAPSTMYQLKKLVQRHKLPSALLGILALIVTGAAVWLGVLYKIAAEDREHLRTAERSAEERRAQAEKSADVARLTREYLIDGVLGAAHPSASQGRPPSVVDALDLAAARFQKEMPDDAFTRAELHFTLGKAYLAWSRFPEAHHHLSAALELYTQPPAHDEQVVQARDGLCDVISRKGDLRGAAAVATENLAYSQRTLDQSRPTALQALAKHAITQWHLSPGQASAELIESAIHALAKYLGPEDRQTQSMQLVWATTVLRWQGRWREAEQELRRLLQFTTEVYGPDDTTVLFIRNSLGAHLREDKRLEESAVLLTETLESLQRIYGRDHVDTVGPLMDLALLRRQQNRLSEAVQLYRRAAQAAERVHGKDHSTRQSALQYLSSVLQRQGRFAEAHAILTDLLESCRRSAGPDHVQTAAAEVELSGLLFNAGHHHEAEQLAAHAAEVFRTVEGATTINALWPLRHLMKCLYAQGKETEARAVAERLLAGRAERAQRDESVTVNAFYFARELLAVEPADLRDPRQAMEVLDAARGTVSDDDDDLNYLMALAYEQLGQPAPAIDLLQPLLERMPIETSVGRNQCEDALFRLWNAAGNTEAGIEVFRRTLALRESQIPSDDVDVAVARIRLGEALVRHGRFAEAAEALRGCDSVDTQLPTWRQAQCKGLHGAALVGIGNEEQGTRLLESACDDLNNDPYAPANVRSTVTDLRFGPLTARVPP